MEQKINKKMRLSSEAKKKVAVPQLEERAREKQRVLSQGAEAKIILTTSDSLTKPHDKTNKSKKVVIKARIPKTYRHPELDKKIRKRRTKSEKKILEKASKFVDIPAVIEVIGDESNFAGNPPQYSIKMEYINGKKLSEHLDNFSKEKQKEICKILGESIAKLHKNEIIHGDLTTSNMIFVSSNSKNKSKVFFIDFGLGYISTKIEDKAVDLHLLTQALESKHFRNWELLLKKIFNSYEKTIGKDYSEKIFQRIKKIEKRGRYKH